MGFSPSPFCSLQVGFFTLHTGSSPTGVWSKASPQEHTAGGNYCLYATELRPPVFVRDNGLRLSNWFKVPQWNLCSPFSSFTSPSSGNLSQFQSWSFFSLTSLFLLCFVRNLGMSAFWNKNLYLLYLRIGKEVSVILKCFEVCIFRNILISLYGRGSVVVFEWSRMELLERVRFRLPLPFWNSAWRTWLFVCHYVETLLVKIDSWTLNVFFFYYVDSSRLWGIVMFE